MAINFKKLFDNNRIKCITTSNRGWVNINCPYCKNPPDTHFNGGFNISNPRYSCFRCGSHSYYDVLSSVLNIPINQVNNILSSYYVNTPVEDDKKIAKGENLNLPGGKLNEQEKQYLINRGYNINYLIDKFHIRGGGIVGEWAYRIILPIYYKRVLISWVGRTILSKDDLKKYKEMGVEIPRYKNLDIEQSVISPKEVFFNLDNSIKDYVIIVEGPFDTLKMGNDCICSLGTSVTRQQELFLKEHYKKVFICFDNEYEAQNKARHLGRNLASLGMDVEVVNICEPFNKNDPGELTYEEVKIIKDELGL